MKIEKSVISNDRYGGNHPNPETVCDGECEGMGIVPVYMYVRDVKYNSLRMDDETNETLIKLWKEAEKKEKSDDGYHFVTCSTCNGSGVRSQNDTRI